jgi:hypothetical protein
MWDMGFDPVETIRWDYSARGMYGASCFGIIGDLRLYGNFILALSIYVDDIDEMTDLVNRVRTDSMGHDTIFYFPGFKVEPIE